MTDLVSNVVPNSKPDLDPWCHQTVIVRDVTPEIEGVATYHLEFANPAAGLAYQFSPGQFNMLYLPGVGEMPISLSADPASEKTWAHTVRVVGNVSGALARLSWGDTLGLRGPFGTPWPLTECQGRDVMIITGGIGLAPLRPAIYHLLKNPRNYGRITLLYGSRSPTLFLYEREYADWGRRGLHMELTVDRATPSWKGNVGVVSLLVDQMESLDSTNTAVLCCGPEIMMRFAAQAAMDRGIAASRIWLSMERNMQCAVGFCGHCQLGPEFICKDGPVLRFDRVASWMKVEGL